MEYFIVYFLFFVWFSTAIFKAELPNRLYNLIPTKFIDDLTNCEFCLETWISFGLCLVAFFVVDPSIGMQSSMLFDIFGDFYFLSFAPLAVGLSHIIKGFYK